ncbi:MAG TPA: DUF4010 domain-containing protein, partial [Gemmatimonadales bacterium]
RVLGVMAVLNPTVAVRLAPYLGLPALLGAASVVHALRRTAPAGAGAAGPERSPLRLGSAIRMAIAFQLVLLAVPYAERLWGSAGVLASAAVLGLTDTDALTFAMARFGAVEGAPAVAARAVAVGVLSNTVFKLGLTLILGSTALRRTGSVGLAGLALGSAIALVWIG